MTTFDNKTDLIQGALNKSEWAIRKVESEIFHTALRFFADEERAKDLTQDILPITLEKIENQKIKTIAGINRSTVWRCKDQLRKERTKKRAPDTPILSTEEEDAQDDRALIPGSKKYHESEEDRIKRTYYTYIPKEIREGIERSLDSIEELYRFRKQVRIARNKYDKIHIILKDLNALKEKIEYVAGRFIKDKATRYSYLQSQGALSIFSNRSKFSKGDLEKLEEFENLGFEGTLPILAYANINELISHAEKAIFFNLYPSRKKFFDLKVSQEDMKKNIPDMGIKPPRLMYAIWSKVKELRRGTKEVNHEKMKLIFAYHKIVTKNTPRMFLFESVRNDLSNYETIRKLQYHKPKSKRFYNKLVKNIFKTSFLGF